MPALRLLAKLLLYYAIVTAAVAAIFWIFPALQDYLPVGRVQALVAEAEGGLTRAQAGAAIHLAHRETLGASLVWLASAILGALLASLPVSWVYIQVRNPEQYDQSLVDTIVMLPIVVTSIVVIVQNSLALAFSLAGIAGAVRFRNSMKSSGDLLFILLAVGIGLAAGIGALELAVVTSIVFNLCFITLWASEYGEREGMKRYLSDIPPCDDESAVGAVGAAAIAMSAAAAKDDATQASRPPDGGQAKGP